MGISLMDRQTPPLPMPRPEREPQQPLYADRDTVGTVALDTATFQKNLSSAGKAAIEVADIEYTTHLQEDLNKNPLFRLGWDIKRLEQRYFPEGARTFPVDIDGKYAHPLTAQQSARTSPKESLQDWYADRGDKVTLYPQSQLGSLDIKAFHLAKMDDASQLLYKREVMAHEFIHRAITAVPELSKARKEFNRSSDDEEIIVGILSAKYFPELKEHEELRIKQHYGVDISSVGLSTAYLWQQADEYEKIATQVLKDKGRHYEPEESSISEDIEAGLQAYHTWVYDLFGKKWNK